MERRTGDEPQYRFMAHDFLGPLTARMSCLSKGLASHSEDHCPQM